MSTSAVDHFLRNAKEQMTQRDINDSIIKAVAELVRDVKQLENDIHRVRREVQMGRHYG